MYIAHVRDRHLLFEILTSDILESGSDDFESGEDIHDAVGSILAEVAGGEEEEDDVIEICNQLMNALKGYVFIAGFTVMRQKNNNNLIE